MKSGNINGLYNEYGVLPMYVRRSSWAKHNYAVIYNVDTTKKYGKCKGLSFINGDIVFDMSCSGCYSWVLLTEEEKSSVDFLKFKTVDEVNLFIQENKKKIKIAKGQSLD